MGRRRKKKQNPKQIEEWQFYLRHINTGRFEFCGGEVDKFPFDPEGLTPENCFLQYDQTGKIHPCSDPETVFKVLRFKKSLNFHIKMWVDCYEDMWQSPDDYIKEFDRPPDWIRKSFMNQLRKKYQMPGEDS